jgi:hypothetical protein
MSLSSLMVVLNAMRVGREHAHDANPGRARADRTAEAAA